MSNLTNNYAHFVNTLLSKDSQLVDEYINRLIELNTSGTNMASLDTAATGMAAEAGEFLEVIKKIKFQGKPFTEDTRFHLQRELGDLMFYVFVALESLNTSFEEIIQMNVDKLQARYPGGQFEVYKSENRADGDI
jgi:NTP pyrophosphatase (non-canonical NTP hydrolase)